MGMKIKRRYLLVEASEQVQGNAQGRFERELCDALLHHMGSDAYSRANPKISGFLDEHRFVIRTNLDAYKETILGLALARSISGRKAAFYTLRSSGTLKALLKK